MIDPNRKEMFLSKDEAEVFKPVHQKQHEQQVRDFNEIKENEAAAKANAAAFICVETYESLYLGNAQASNSSVLEANAITHVFAVGKDLPPCLDTENRVQDADVSRTLTPNAAAEDDLQYEYERQGVRYMCLEVEDKPETSLLNYAHGANDFIGKALKSGGRVLVLDADAGSLAATMLATYLVVNCSIKSDEALQLITSKHPPVSLGKERQRHLRLLDRNEGQLPEWALPA